MPWMYCEGGTNLEIEYTQQKLMEMVVDKVFQKQAMAVTRSKVFKSQSGANEAAPQMDWCSGTEK